MFVHLSHKLTAGGIRWPGSPATEIQPVKQIGQNGFACNTFTYTVSNHCGTHMDAPAHFTHRRLTLSDLPERYFGYEGHEVCLLEIPKGRDEGVLREELEPHAAAIQNARLLLIRTGFEAMRHEAPAVYENNGPYFTAEASQYLNQTFPGLDCLGLDFISLGAPNCGCATEAHRWLLGWHSEHFTCIVEDMCLSALENRPIKCVTLGPARVQGTDSGQAWAMAWLG